MKLRTFLCLSLLSAAPSLLRAQPLPDSLDPVVPPAPAAPKGARAPRAAMVPAALISATAEVPPMPPAPPTPLTSDAPEPPQPPSSPRVTPAPALLATPPAPPAPPRSPAQMVNVRIDVTLSDSKGSAKTLTMTVADGESGMNRTKSIISGTDYSFNADARPTLTGNKIRLRLTADAVVPLEGGKSSTEPGSKLGLSQSQTLILNDGETVEVARAADPVSDRAFILTVKVTIQR